MGISQEKFKAFVSECNERFKVVLGRSIEGLPIAEKYVSLIFSFLFPAQILQQLIVSGSLQLLVMFFTASYSIFGSYIAILLSKNKRKIQELTRKLEKECANYDEWIQLADELDRLNGSDKWRKSEDSLLCDCSILKRRTKDLVEMINTGDLFNLMFRLRGGLARDQYGIQNEALFHKSPAGTLHIVEKYHQVVVNALNTVCDSKDSGEIPTDAKLAFFNETRHSYGRTALLLSGGAYLGYYHMGLSKALWSQGLFPRVISGASAGSLMAAIVGTRTDSELEEVFYMPDGKLTYRTDFFKHSTTLTSSIGKKIQQLLPQSLYTFGSWLLSVIFDGKMFNLDSKHFKRVVLDNVGTYTFQEAFDRTGRIINVTVAPSNNYDPPRLLNYLTAPHVCVWSAAVASCALPGIFDSSPLIVKEPSGVFRPEHEWTRHSVGDNSNAHVYTDGSLESDLPMQQLSELFNINHFIISQVNPHSAFLSSLSLRSSPAQSTPILGVVVGYVRFLKAMLRDWAKNLVNLVNYRSSSSTWSTKRGMFQTLTQDYEGRENDVTITPWANHISPVQAFLSILKNPTLEEYEALTLVAQRNTWPFIATIRAHCMIEMALDKCVQRLRKRISAENEVSKLDRTPSFYTSRSIINLSGLSVADPLPKSPNASTVKLQSLLKNKKESTSTRSPLSLKASHQQDSEDCFLVDQTTVAPDYLDDESLTLTVRAADAYLDLDEMEEKVMAGSDGSKNSSSNNLIEDGASIHKTTNMASFYYQNTAKSNSEHELNEILDGGFW
jgi:TAG lipase/steryl ester hydrolase/phospholipase A2/LPA acyltransferase